MSILAAAAARIIVSCPVATTYRVVVSMYRLTEPLVNNKVRCAETEKRMVANQTKLLSNQKNKHPITETPPQEILHTYPLSFSHPCWSLDINDSQVRSPTVISKECPPSAGSLQIYNPTLGIAKYLEVLRVLGIGDRVK